MKVRFLTWLGALLLTMFSSTVAWAGPGDFTCTIVNLGSFNTSYSGFSTNPTYMQINFAVRCTRAARFGTSQNGTASFSVTANNGDGGAGPAPASTPASIPNTAYRASGLSPALNYDLYTSSACTTNWTGAIFVTANLPTSSLSTQTLPDIPFAVFACINAGQTTVPAGSYLDNISLTISGSASGGGNPQFIAGTPNPASLTSSITVIKECFTSVNAVNTLVDFGIYTAFGGARSSFGGGFYVQCTGDAAYTMALTDGAGTSLTNGVVAGLNYSLALSASGGTGNGSIQPYTINGTMPGGQAGSCASGACAGTTTNTSHYLTVTY